MLYYLLKNKKKRERSVLAKPFLGRRINLGLYEMLVQELRFKDKEEQKAPTHYTTGLWWDFQTYSRWYNQNNFYKLQSWHHEGVSVTIGNPAFCLTLHLTSEHFRGELQHVGDVSEQQIKCPPIRTWETGGARLSEELYVMVQARINGFLDKTIPRCY